MSEVREIMSDNEYVRTQGSRCPNCRSTNLGGHDTDFNADYVFNSVMCHHCGSSWTEIYKLQGYDDLDIPDGPVSSEEAAFSAVNINSIGIVGLPEKKKKVPGELLEEI